MNVCSNLVLRFKWCVKCLLCCNFLFNLLYLCGHFWDGPIASIKECILEICWQGCFSCMYFVHCSWPLMRIVCSKCYYLFLLLTETSTICNLFICSQQPCIIKQPMNAQCPFHDLLMHFMIYYRAIISQSLHLQLYSLGLQ